MIAKIMCVTCTLCCNSRHTHLLISYFSIGIATTMHLQVNTVSPELPIAPHPKPALSFLSHCHFGHIKTWMSSFTLFVSFLIPNPSINSVDYTFKLYKDVIFSSYLLPLPPSCKPLSQFLMYLSVFPFTPFSRILSMRIILLTERSGHVIGLFETLWLPVFTETEI